MVDVHRVSVLCNDVEADGNAFSSLVDETYPLGIFHHRSALLVSYTGKDKFPRADIRLILVEDNKAHRTRCGFTVRFEDIPDLVEMLLTMLRNVAPDVTYPTKQFVKNPIEFPDEAVELYRRKKKDQKSSSKKKETQPRKAEKTRKSEEADIDSNDDIDKAKKRPKLNPKKRLTSLSENGDDAETDS